MARQTVYIESTVISYCAAHWSRDIVTMAHQQITSDWWNMALPLLDPYISQIVIDEISRGDKEAVHRRIAAVKQFKVLETTEEAARLAERYFDALTIPEKARNDALHLAIATLNGMDYLVTWNFKHIASARVRAVIEAVNYDLSYETPIICSPEELMEVEP